ncbi:hypothetical protein [Streptomyces sp. NRRL S-1022]|uniref:hypothetical protein n=1 Tax=Streptomyces sp. NRRL S-1022 TaxID=1463880 RepID=UPI0004C1E988|nr:hypothetical protein [Streptomyces sp. NRRL S-1022]
MRRVHSGHAAKTEQALLARATTAPIPAARHPQHDTGPTTDEPAQHSDNDGQGANSEGDSIDDLDGAPYDDLSPNPGAGFGLYDAYEEADKW